MSDPSQTPDISGAADSNLPVVRAAGDIVPKPPKIWWHRTRIR